MTHANQLTAPEAPTAPMIQHFGQSLQPQQRSEHRAWIGVKVEAVLHGYFKETPSAPVWAEMMRDWMDALDQFDEETVRAAFRDWVRDNPSKRPNPGHIRALAGKRILQAMPQARVSPLTDMRPIEERVTADRANELLEEAGFAAKRMTRVGA